MKKVLKVLLIILLIIILIVAGGLAYLYFNGMSGMSNTSEPKEGQIKIACAGDSTTYGHGISGWPKNNYPTVLQNLLPIPLSPVTAIAKPSWISFTKPTQNPTNLILRRLQKALRSWMNF